MAARPRHYLTKLEFWRKLPMRAAIIIEEGHACGIDTNGRTGPLDTTNFVGFAGFAGSLFDNSGGAAGLIDAEMYVSGIIQLTIADIADTSPDAIVFSSASDVFTMTVGTNVPIGRVVHRLGGTIEAYVAFQALCMLDHT